MTYRLIDHTADLGLQVEAATLPGLFTEAAYALLAVMGARASGTGEVHELALEGLDPEDLLVRWLQEILFLAVDRGLRVERIIIDELTKVSLKARVEGRACGGELLTEIKAVTYHDLAIERRGERYRATFICDT